MNETPQHTPGPWKVHRIPIYPTLEVFSFRNGSAQRAICGLSPVRGGGVSEQDEANALLIAAAPDLLEAAVWCKALCEELGATGTNAYAAARSAIDKAKGRA